MADAMTLPPPTREPREAARPQPAHCHCCLSGVLEPVERTETYYPPDGAVEVRTWAARCPRCGATRVLPGQAAENLARRRARAARYGAHLLGEDIAALRRRHGLSREAAAAVFGCDRFAFSRFESESRFPDAHTRELIALALRYPQVLRALAELAGVVVPAKGAPTP